MKLPKMRIVACAAIALVMAAASFGRAPSPEEALDYAKSVVLVKRVVKDKQVHAYVKEVWRFDPAAGEAPAVGAEYGTPMPYDARLQSPERDGIFFAFGPHRPKGVTPWWRIPVTEDGRVPIFHTDVEGVRAEVRSTKPKA